MKYNKLQAYQDNYNALEEIFKSNKEKRKPNPEILLKYKGYGGLKEVLLPINKKEEWAKSNQKYYEQVLKLYSLIHSHLPLERGDRMMGSIKNNVLSSFYTDNLLIDPIFKSIKENTDTNHQGEISMLDPACGKGVFLHSAKKNFLSEKFKGVGFDIDRIAAFIAEKTQPGSKIIYDGFQASDSFIGDDTFDIVASNIPFGDFRVFDESYAKSRDLIKKDSQKRIHNYFFVKGLDKTRPGGMLAYYTSIGVMDSPSNEDIRAHLIKNAEFVCAIRLPNNTFQESAGTKVVSDLILLRKREVPLNDLKQLTEEEKAFIKHTKVILQTGKDEKREFFISSYFQNIHPENILGKLQPGKFHGARDVLTVDPGKNFSSIEDISKGLSVTLNRNFKRFNERKNVLQKQKMDVMHSGAFANILSDYNLKIALLDNKTFVLQGNTYPFKYFFGKKLRGRWDGKQKGWVFPLSRQEEIYIALHDFLKNASLKKIQKIPDNLQYTLNFGIEQEPTDEPAVSKISPELAEEHYLVGGNLFYMDGQIGVIKKNENGKFVLTPLRLSEEEIETAKELIDLRITYKRLYDLELRGIDGQASRQRELLNFKYDKFVENHGHIGAIKHRKIADNEAELYKLYALERQEKGKIIKADIFFKPTFQLEAEPRIETLSDGILSSLNEYGKINLSFLSETLNRTEKELLNEGVKEGLIFPNPVFPPDFNGLDKNFYLSDIKYEWVTKDIFLSGNIRDKLLLIEKLEENNSLSKEITTELKEALQKICPPFLDINLINLQPGERWIDKEIYEGFAKDLLQCDVDLIYKKSSDQYEVKIKGYSGENQITYAVRTKNGRGLDGQVLLSHALNDTSPNITYKIGEVTFPDTEGMRKAEMIIDQIKKKFPEFVVAREHYVNHLEKKYNFLFNQNVKREFDGTHLKFPGLDHFNPHTHQKDASWMIIQNNGGIIDHKVGAGKTLLMAISAMEMKRLGVSKKTLIIAKKANADAIQEDFALAYPNAKILMPNINDTSPKNKQTFFEKIMTNDWDAIVMTHDQFLKIPQSRETMIAVMQEQVNDLENDLGDQKLTKQQLKGLEKRKINLEAKIQEAYASIKKDPRLLSFEKMGIDHLMIDESHVFKNLAYTTRHQNIAGLGQPDGSARSLNLLTAIRTLQQKHKGDKGVTFLSGTIISNSLVELYLLFKYLRPEKLKQLHIESFDGWAKVFAQKSSDFEITHTGEIKKRERFRTFIKVPELASLYNEIAHVVGDTNFKVDKPKVKPVLVDVEPTAAQIEYMQKLVIFCKTGDTSVIDLPSMTTAQLQAKMLIATNLAKKASIDMRLIDPDYDFGDAGKLTKLCENISEYHSRFNEDRGVQLVFCDIGVPGGKDLNLYQEIKDTLVRDYSVLEEDIEFIHDHDILTKKRALNMAVNKGEKRIIIGSTDKLGTGVNMQERVVAIHQLDIPWRPSDYEQRNGRGSRQGNWLAKEKNNNQVDVFVYATNRSLDAYKFSLLASKQNFIRQIKDSSISSRKVSEADTDGAVSFAEFMAATSGNQDLLKKAKLERTLANLEAEADLQQLQRVKGRQEKEILISRISNAQKNIERLSKDQKEILPLFSGDKNILVIDGEKFEKAKDIGEGLLKKIKEGKKTKTEIAEIPGKIGINYDPLAGKVEVASKISNLVYSYNNGELNKTPSLAGQFVKRAINRIPYICKNNVERLVRLEKDLEGINKKLSEELKDYSTEINALRAEISNLEKSIEKDSERISLKQGQKI